MKGVALLILHCVSASLRETHAAELPKPNIVLTPANDLGHGDGGGHGPGPGKRAFGGLAKLRFTGETNSDVEDGRFKPDAPEEQLYDLGADPRQTRNVVREQLGIAARVRAELAGFVA